MIVVTVGTDRVERWAEAWEPLPDKATTFADFPELVNKVADWYNFPPSSAADVQDEFVEAMVSFKQSWVGLSHDSTEAGQTSDSLDRLADALRTSYGTITDKPKLAIVVGRMLPKSGEITTKFLSGGFSCHHNAAREIRPVFEQANFESLLEGPATRSQFQRYLLRRWNDLTFSAKA